MHLPRTPDLTRFLVQWNQILNGQGKYKEREASYPGVRQALWWGTTLYRVTL